MSILPERKAQIQRFSPRGRSTARRVEIQGEAYNGVYAMAMQRDALTSIQSLDAAEDQMRRQLHQTLLQQRRALAEGNVGLAKGLNQVAITLLGVVDQLDGAQDIDPVAESFGRNFETAQACRRVVSLTDDPEVLQ